IAVASFPDRTIRRLGAELGGVVAETELAIGRVRVTVRQETSGLYAVAVRRTEIDAGAVRQAYEIGLLVGPGCAVDEHEAQPRNHRQYTKRHGAASAVELERGLGGHAVRTRDGHTRTLGRPPLGRSPPRPDAEQALCRRADVFALRRSLRMQGNRRAGGVANCQAWRSVPSQGGTRAIHAHRRCARPPHAPAEMAITAAPMSRWAIAMPAIRARGRIRQRSRGEKPGDGLPSARRLLQPPRESRRAAAALTSHPAGPDAAARRRGRRPLPLGSRREHHGGALMSVLVGTAAGLFELTSNGARLIDELGSRDVTALARD